MTAMACSVNGLKGQWVRDAHRLPQNSAISGDVAINTA
jgi:hypothetical protein